MIKNKSVQYILFACIFIGILIPLLNLFFIYPSLTKKILIKNIEADTMGMAMNLLPMFKQEYVELTKDSIHPDLIKQLETYKKDFQFLKLKLFSKDGKIIYSSDPKEIEKVNDTPYFHKIVAKGNPYSKAVKKDIASLEGEAVVVDIVETHVPIMNENKFVGAIEIYYDITLRNQALNKILLKASVFPFVIMFGGFIFTVIVLIHLDKSISKQKKADEELKTFAEKLQRSNRELEGFAHIASHDLQEPLRKVVAFGDRLAAKYSETLGEQGRDYLKRMQSAGKRMQNLINSLLTFSRVTTKGLPFVPVNLVKVTRDVLSDLEVRIEQANAHIEIGDLPTIDADPLQMPQLLQNLISNALKFAKKDTPPLIKIYGKVIQDYGGNNLSQLTVEDNGIGFDEKYADRIFDIFQRLYGREEYEGSGIGLSICRKIVERHNGKITAESSPGKGTSFIITLPLKQRRE